MQHIRSFLKHTRLTIVLALLALGASTALATSIVYDVSYSLQGFNGPLIITVDAECSGEAVIVVTDSATGTQTVYQHGGPLNGIWQVKTKMQPNQRYQVEVYCLENPYISISALPLQPDRVNQIIFSGTTITVI